MITAKKAQNSGPSLAFTTGLITPGLPTGARVTGKAKGAAGGIAETAEETRIKGKGGTSK